MNIVSGQVVDDTVNVQDAVAIGTMQMQDLEKGWPEGFWSKISKKVKTVSEACQGWVTEGMRYFSDLQ